MEDTQKHFETNIKILKFGGLGYSEKLKSWFDYCYIIYTILAIIIIFLFFTPSEFVSLYELKNDMMAFMNNLGIVSSHVVAAVKVCNYILRRAKIKDLIINLENESLDYEIDDFKPNDIVKESKHKSYKFTLLFLFSVELVLWLNYSTAIFNMIFFESSFYSLDKFGNKQYCTKLPFYSWIPFNHSTKPTCLLAIFLQFVILNVLALMIIGVDTLFISLVNLVTAHLHILYYGFKFIPKRCLYKRKNNPLVNFDEEMHNEMKKCVIHLNNIQKVCDNLEDIFKYTTMIQVFTSLCVTCACMFLLATEEIGSKNFIIQLLHITAIQLQITLYCWFGNELTLASMEIPHSLYESEWFSSSIDYKKSMLMTMRKMTNKPFILTLGKFSPLTLDTLVMILRGSYSLYAVLKHKNTTETNFKL